MEKAMDGSQSGKWPYKTMKPSHEDQDYRYGQVDRKGAGECQKRSHGGSGGPGNTDNGGGASGQQPN